MKYPIAIAALLLAAAPAAATPRASDAEHTRRCLGAFIKNKAEIERLAARSDGRAITALMARGGCPNAVANLPPPGRRPAGFWIECSWAKGSPGSIRCNWGTGSKK